MYRIGEYYRTKKTRVYFKIVGIPNNNQLRIKTMHDGRTFLLNLDEFEGRFKKVTIAYIAGRAKKLIKDIDKALKENDNFLAKMRAR